MLVLSRQVGDKITVGKDITITVVRIDRNKIRLGITAPKEVLILRAELLSDPEEDDPEIDDRHQDEPN